MAKALLGHVMSGPDVRLAAEVRRLRDRVQELEHELALLRAANAALSSERRFDEDMLTLAVPDGLPESREPAYT